MTSFLDCAPAGQRPAHPGRRIELAAFASLEHQIETGDCALLIVSGAAVVMAPGEFEAATGLLGPGALVALAGPAAPATPARLTCVSRLQGRLLSAEDLEDEPAAAWRTGEAQVRTLAQLHRQAQTTASCAMRHLLQQRAAAWLLALSDALQADELRIGQAALARVLGVQRTTVTAAVSELARAGAVRPGRNRLVIADRDRLAARSCGCMA